MSIVQLGLVFAICAPFILAIWVAFVHRPPLLVPEAASPDAIGEFALTHASFEAETIDLEQAVRTVADAVGDLSRARSVRVELAIRPGTKVRVDPNALRFALRSTVMNAICATPGGQVLIAATTLGSQLHVRITDDGANADQLAREGLARGATALIALQGGSIAIEARPGQGTTVTVRLPLPGDQGSSPGDQGAGSTTLSEMPTLAAHAA